MYCVTGDKSYLLTDHHPSRKYFVVKFTDGNGKQWFQLGYRWGLWTFWLQSVRRTEYGNVDCPLRFASCEAANDHIKEEREWLARKENSMKVTTEVVFEEVAASRPQPYAKSDEKRVFYDTKSPRNGALSGCETVPDPGSRVWETPRTPQPHPTPPQGSVQDEGSFRDSQNANEPVAWAVMERDGFGIECTFTDRDEAAEWCDSRQQIVPLYRSPTITDEEREAVEAAVDFCESTDKPLPRSEQIATLRKLLERLK